MRPVSTALAWWGVGWQWPGVLRATGRGASLAIDGWILLSRFLECIIPIWFSIAGFLMIGVDRQTKQKRKRELTPAEKVYRPDTHAIQSPYVCA